jgi:hypothetical protein
MFYLCILATVTRALTTVIENSQSLFEACFASTALASDNKSLIATFNNWKNTQTAKMHNKTRRWNSKHMPNKFD